ncbi:hypothetical protein BST14_03870 [Mycobacterium arosiense ATCC BAA-1401 = DSM 45069]|uniref:Acyl-CoA dehydrogenase/oxidase N-terminal domain-containing protein n=1 Tax=Mycobacterium arosiense ATCC BAA-1401 = DSM 45069 TaxID=1265311 RepID=A0A1W9ZPV4_MYCAI|nr:hypothetical protein BST14_03870 [Mycobacterium arosiense ATCC BAA-1401 = DSM 45069]
MKRLIYEAEHEQLRETTKQYLEREVAPNAEKWERDRIVDQRGTVEMGHDGTRPDTAERRCRPLLQTPCQRQQKKRWLPTINTGETIVAIAMTEPGAVPPVCVIGTAGSQRFQDLHLVGLQLRPRRGRHAD